MRQAEKHAQKYAILAERVFDGTAVVVESPLPPDLEQVRERLH